MAKKVTPKGKTPKQLVKKHIEDEKDIISEDEFKNMEIGPDVQDDKEPLKIDDDKERPKDEGKDSPMNTPWDVIS